MSTIVGSDSGDLEAALPPSPQSTPSPKPEQAASPRTAKSKPKRMMLVAGVICLAVMSIGATRLLKPFSQDTSDLVFHTVERGTLLISVTERGNLESQQNLKVFCEVDDIRGDNIDGTAILEIVPNGTDVAEGDLLVKLDSSGHIERVDAQILDTEAARAAKLQADISYQNTITQSETLEKEAELAVKLAELQLEMFQHPENGTSALEADEINRTIDDTENEILAAKANLKLIENDRKGTEELFKLGYAGKNEVDKMRLDYLQAQSAVAAKINRLETQLATLQKKTDFERRMSLMQLEGDKRTAERALGQVRLNNTAEIAKAKVALDAANRQLNKEEERLARYREQLEKCEIFAQQDGMVAYATPSRYSRSSTIAEGALLRERQHILSLPNLKMMQVKTAVHESVQSQITAGLPVTVRIDAFPDQSYVGSVKSIGVLPDQQSWHSSDTKMYETYVTIDEEVVDLKPGMTAMVQIHIDEVHDVLSVPVQAVQQEEKTTFLFVERNNRVEKQVVEVGRTNDKYVEIVEGVNDNERVVLNPLAVVN